MHFITDRPKDRQMTVSKIGQMETEVRAMLSSAAISNLLTKDECREGVGSAMLNIKVNAK